VFCTLNYRLQLSTISASNNFIYIYFFYFAVQVFVCGAAVQRGPWPPHSWSFLITLSDAPHSVGLLQTGDHLVVKTSTWQNTTVTTGKHPSPPAGFEPTVSAGERRRLCLRPRGHWDRLTVQFFFCLSQQPQWAMASSCTRFLDHIQRPSTIGRASVGGRSARGRDLYLTTHKTHDIHDPVGIRNHNLSRRAAVIYALDRAATWTAYGAVSDWKYVILSDRLIRKSERDSTWEEATLELLRCNSGISSTVPRKTTMCFRIVGVPVRIRTRHLRM